MTISRFNVRPDGNPEQTSTMTFYTRDSAIMDSVRSGLPDFITQHALTVFDGNVGYAAIDGKRTSRDLIAAFAPHLPEGSVAPISKLISGAVVGAQAAAAGLGFTGVSDPQSFVGNNVSTTVANVVKPSSNLILS